MGCLHAITLAAFLGLAATWDLRERRVPNRLIAAFIVTALGLRAALEGLSGLWWAGGGCAIGICLLLLPFILGFVGAGDVKFFGTLGGFLGARLTLCAFLLGTVLGGVAAAASLWRARSHRLRAAGQAQPPRQASSAAARARTLPYVVPLGLGAVAAVVLDRAGLWPL